MLQHGSGFNSEKEALMGPRARTATLSEQHVLLEHKLRNSGSRHRSGFWDELE